MRNIYHGLMTVNFEKALIYYGVLGGFLLSFIIGVIGFQASAQFGVVLTKPLWALNFLYFLFVTVLLVASRQRVSVLTQKSAVYVIIGYVAAAILSLIQPPFAQAGEMSGMVVSYLLSLLF